MDQEGTNNMVLGCNVSLSSYTKYETSIDDCFVFVKEKVVHFHKYNKKLGEESFPFVTE